MIPQGFSQTVAASPTVFYLHTAYSVGSPSERILSTDPPYGIQRWIHVTEATAFVLRPPVRRAVRIGGPVSFQLWLRATTPVIGTVNATLVERTSDGKVRYVCGIEASVLVESVLNERPYFFSIGPVMRTIDAGSTLILEIVVKVVNVPVFLYWDDSRAPSQVAISFVERYYYTMIVTAKDFSDKRMKGANVTIMQKQVKVWTGTTTADGSVEAIVPSTENTSLYDIQIYWKGTGVNKTGNISLTADRELVVRCEVYDLMIIVRDFFGMPLGQAGVELVAEDRPLGLNRTQFDGHLIFSQVPKGNYTLDLSYESLQHTRRDITVSGPTEYVTRLPVLQPWFYYGAPASAVIVIGAIVLISKYRQKTRKISFDLLNNLFGGQALTAAAVMVIGSPGSGKTVLMEKMMHDRLSRENKCVYVTNNDFPRKIVEDMKQLGLDVSAFEGRHLYFIDCYSGTAGKVSPEKYSVQVLTDLTNLGTQISSAANALGEGTTFFLDSLAPLFTSLGPDPIMTFIHAIGARIKGQVGSLYFSVGTGLDKDVLSRLEGLSDCIIELETYRKRGVPSRRLRIKKIRGRKHSQRWIEFSIEAPDGIVFHGDKERFSPRKAS
jgi:KaiC/GvpD/RAD55 family RecA-like ATPase